MLAYENVINSFFSVQVVNARWYLWLCNLKYKLIGSYRNNLLSLADKRFVGDTDVCVFMCGKSVSYTHLDVYKRQVER